MAGAFSVGGWHVEPSSRTLTGPSGEVHLEPKVMQVLVLLAKHQGEVVTKELLFHVVGDYIENVYLIPSQDGAPKRLTFDNKAVWGPLAWTPDATAILFESSRGGSPELWRVPAAGGQPERLSVAANASGGVGLDNAGRRLAYVVRNIRFHISAFDLSNPGEPSVRVAESTRSEFSPSFSSDGNRIAFASDRAGDALDIWVADADGANPRRLTWSSHGENGSPRWSPDDEWLAYDSSVNGQQFDVCVIQASGGPPRRLTFDRSNEYGPSWSRDGRWLYFASDRAGRDQIYKMPRAGGAPVQITKGGGFPGAESADGRFLYYSKGRDQAGVWRVPIDGGLEEPVIMGSPRPNTTGSGRSSKTASITSTRTMRHARVWTSSDSRRIAPSAYSTCRGRLTWRDLLAVSPNRRSLLTCFIDPRGSEIFMVENFR